MEKFLTTDSIKELEKIADSGLLCGRASGIIRLAMERLDILSATNSKLCNRVDDLLANNNDKHERIISLVEQLDDARGHL